tara:strand:- start:8166 stop:9275 length:1110 start_codon:yes stop_codon:yes gene_type:complete
MKAADRRSLIAVYSAIFLGFSALVAFVGAVSADEVWTLNATSFDSASFLRSEVEQRTRRRGMLASALTALTFSFTINAAIDKFALIDPSTSTALIGIVLGQTFGFVMDNLLGSDEGLREYLRIGPTHAMQYAFGSLASARFARFLVTVAFDMFVTTTLFKHIFPIVRSLPGFRISGQFLANAVSSSLITTLCFQAFTNSLRFSWAYPSASETVFDQFISGHVVTLAVVIMSMTWLATETRCDTSERGINAPRVKLAFVLSVLCLLAGLQLSQRIDPTNDHDHGSGGADDLAAPLPGVDEAKRRWAFGLALFGAISSASIGGVVFGTSKAHFVAGSAALTKLVLFATFYALVALLVTFFTLVPLFRAVSD